MSEKSFAVSFGAGGARGLAHIHAIKAFDELGIKPTQVSGTSIGSIIGAGYCAGMSGDEIEDYVLGRFSSRMKVMGDLLKLRPESITQFMGDGGPRFGEINIERVMKIFLPKKVPNDFSQLEIALQIVATDYYGHCDYIFNKGPLYKAIAASSAIPAVFRPVISDETVLIDGGATNPTPFDLLQGKADKIIAIDVSGGPEGDKTQRPGKIDVLYAMPQLLQLTIVNEKMKHYALDALFRPSMGDVRALDFMKSKAILSDTQYFKDEVKQKVSQLLK